MSSKLDRLYWLKLKLALEALETSLDQLGAFMLMLMVGLCTFF